MAATYDAEKMTSELFARLVDFDPDTGNATLVTLVPAATEKCIALAANGVPQRFLFGVFKSVGTGGTTTVTVIAATAADGTGQTTVKQITPTTQDAVGDTVWVEVDTAQIKEVLATATHVGLEIDLVTSTDECVVAVIAGEVMYKRNGLTANYIS